MSMDKKYANGLKLLLQPARVESMRIYSMFTTETPMCYDIIEIVLEGKLVKDESVNHFLFNRVSIHACEWEID